MYKKGAGNDKQVKDAGNRTLCPYRNFSQAIIRCIERLLDLGTVTFSLRLTVHADFSWNIILGVL